MSGKTLKALACLTTVVAAGVAAAAPTMAVTPLTYGDIRKAEVPLGDLVTDAIKQASGAQAALVAAKDFRPAGEVKAGARVVAADVTAFLVQAARPWVVSKITGECLKAALERSLARAPDQESAHFLQVAGLRVTYDPQGPEGQKVRHITIDGADVDEAATYRVAMPEDLARGGAGYFVVPCFTKDNIDEEGGTGTVLEAVDAYLEQTAAVDYPKLDRIKAVAD